MAEPVEDADVVEGRTTRWSYLSECIYPPDEYILDREGYMVPVRSRQDCDDLIALLERVRERLP